MSLPDGFLTRPIAHRALHDLADGRPENSLAAVRAAVDLNYGIEIDLQLSSDEVAMVFHDYDLGRLTGENGAVRQRSSANLQAIPLLGSLEGIPTLQQVLDTVAGRVPLLIELKDQDGALGPNVGILEDATVDVLSGYDGPVALMSFNPHMVANCARLAPHLPRGLTSDRFDDDDWGPVPAARRAELVPLPDYDRVGACFVSHHWRDLASEAVAGARAKGAKLLCWTIRTPEEEAQAREWADNITFEGYRA